MRVALGVSVLVLVVFERVCSWWAGPKNDQLYITSAHCGDDEIQARYPQSGHLFTLDLEGAYVGAVRGMFKGGLSV